MWEYRMNNYIYIDEHLNWDLVENNLFIYSSQFFFIERRRKRRAKGAYTRRVNLKEIRLISSKQRDEGVRVLSGSEERT